MFVPCLHGARFPSSPTQYRYQAGPAPILTRIGEWNNLRPEVPGGWPWQPAGMSRSGLSWLPPAARPPAGMSGDRRGRLAAPGALVTGAAAGVGRATRPRLPAAGPRRAAPPAHGGAPPAGVAWR